MITVDDGRLAQTIAALTEGETNPVAPRATVTCEVHHSDDGYDCPGFCRVVAPCLLKIGVCKGRLECLVTPRHCVVRGQCHQSNDARQKF